MQVAPSERLDGDAGNGATRWDDMKEVPFNPVGSNEQIPAVAEISFEGRPYKERPPVPELKALDEASVLEDGRAADNTKQKLEMFSGVGLQAQIDRGLQLIDTRYIKDAASMLSMQFPDTRFVQIRPSGGARMEVKNSHAAVMYPMFVESGRSFGEKSIGEGKTFADDEASGIYRVLQERLGLDPDFLRDNDRFMQAFVYAHENGHFIDGLMKYNEERGESTDYRDETIASGKPFDMNALSTAFHMQTDDGPSGDVRFPSFFRMKQFVGLTGTEYMEDPETGIKQSRMTIAIPPHILEEVFGEGASEIKPRQLREKFARRMGAIGFEQQFARDVKSLRARSMSNYREARNEAAADNFALDFIESNLDQYVYDASNATSEQIENDDRVPFYPGSHKEILPEQYDWLDFCAGRRMDICSCDADGKDGDDEISTLTLNAPLIQGEQLQMNISGDVYDESVENIMQLGAIKKIDVVSCYRGDKPSQVTIIETEIIDDNGEPKKQYFRIARPADGKMYEQIDANPQKLLDVLGLHEGAPVGITCVEPAWSDNNSGISYGSMAFGALGSVGAWEKGKPASGFEIGNELKLQNMGDGSDVLLPQKRRGDSSQTGLGTVKRVYQEGLTFYVETDVSTFRVDSVLRGEKYRASRIINDDDVERMAAIASGDEEDGARII